MVSVIIFSFIRVAAGPRCHGFAIYQEDGRHESRVPSFATRAVVDTLMTSAWFGAGLNSAWPLSSRS
ncbi:hypothetical protein APU90_05350 [Rathayibacter toxicus]|nr:hypothetical protein APU90_05350 [Rathayibacter toxicus]